jgi:hypothetical protein
MIEVADETAMSLDNREGRHGNTYFSIWPHMTISYNGIDIATKIAVVDEIAMSLDSGENGSIAFHHGRT